MAYRTDPEFEDEDIRDAATPGTWVAAATAVSVLIIASVTLTVVAGGWDLSSTFPFG